ncbi:MAG: hypothetical protein K2G90_09100 [Muribaculaceae bacterium]|nr:hypothetical protein [Muribaculaceae bacterium]
MMKKSFLFTAAASVLCLASCSQDDFAPVQDNNENGNVTFTVSLNDKPATRAFGDGYSAKNLAYAVYDISDTEPKLAGEGKTEFSANSLSTTLNITLANGRDYRIAFFASNQNEEGNNVYSFDAENKKITVDYSKTHLTAHQNVDQDCFFNVLEVSKDQIGSSLSVTLNRPVAQINFGTADLGEDAVKAAYGENGANLRTTLTTTAYTTLNLLDGIVDLDSKEEFTTTTPAKIIAKDDGTFPVDGYDYVHCAYVLVPKTEKSVAEVTLTITGGTAVPQTVKVSNVPLQANYRTNIYGNLLTSTTDITVDKDADWSDPDYIYNVVGWDGTVADKLPEINTSKEMFISSPQELAKVAEYVNSGNSLSGITLKLTSDMDLNGFNWTPIGNNTNKFQGSFDGQGYTISNLSITQKDVADYAGLFGVAWPAGDFKNVTIDGVDINTRAQSGSAPVGSLIGSANLKTISDITVRNVKIRSYRQTGGIVGAIYGSINNCVAENIDIELTPNRAYKTVLGVTVPYWDNGDKAGAIVGFDAEGSGSFTNNKVDNVKIKAYRDMGGLFGRVFNNTYSDNSASNVTIIRSTDQFVALGGTANAANHGPIAGRIDSQSNGGNNTFSKYTYIDHQGNSQNWSTEADWN